MQSPPLFHGTTESRATRLAVDGIRIPSNTDVIAQIADRYGIDPDVLRDDLFAHGRFITARDDDDALYVTTTFNHARNYASRSPEMEWEALWGVYRLEHPTLGFDWNLSNPGHLWVLNQQLSDPSVVVELTVDMNELMPPGEGDEFVERLAQRIEVGRLLGGDNGIEIKIPAHADVQVIAVHDTGRLIDMPLLLFVTGDTPEDLMREVQAGAWGDVIPYRQQMYLKWTDVQERLPDDRLIELGLVPEE